MLENDTLILKFTLAIRENNKEWIISELYYSQSYIDISCFVVTSYSPVLYSYSYY
jgi:hypothetical protein